MQHAKTNHRILLKGKDRTDSVLNCQFIGNRCSVTFKDGSVYSYHAENVKIIEPASDAEKRKLTYFKELATKIGIKIKVDSGEEINLLERFYSDIESVPSDSIAKNILSEEMPDHASDKERDLKNSLYGVIYPFEFNVSQKEAVDNALIKRLSFIEGPPGTGKTQTILNIIANAVVRGKSVAVVSSNNSATQNVLDKLRKKGFGFIAASLGNRENREKFLNNQSPLPDIRNWRLAGNDLAALHDDLHTRYRELHEKLTLQTRLAELRQLFSATQTEQQYFLEFYRHIDIPQDIKIEKLNASARAMLELALLCETHEDYIEKSRFVRLFLLCLEHITFWDRRKLLIRRLAKHCAIENLFALFQKKFYEARLAELDATIRTISSTLESFDIRQKMSEYSELSNKIFKAALAEKYINHPRKYYSKESLQQEPREFLKDYPVILSTAYSLRNCLPRQILYDYIIIDEASQVDLCTGFLALNCAKNAVIVGDLKQLPNVVDAATCACTDSLFAKYKLDKYYQYSKQSLLSSLSQIFPQSARVLLREHYRCNPKIIEFCNKKFYNDQLIIMTENKSERDPLRLYKTVAGNHARDHRNQRQIDMIKDEIIPENHICITDDSLGIVTPYRNQSNALEQAFKDTGIKANTVDKFQGQENRIIILSTVDNEIGNFTDNPNRLNVAVSRAIEQLIVIVNDGDALIDKNIGDLVRYIQYNNFSVRTSKIHSIFDYLYKEYNELRKGYLKSKKMISQYDSENLMYSLLCDILKEEENLEAYDISHHVPLRMLLRDARILNEEEKRYAFNRLTHVDFLLFNKFDKSPKLAVEVDGTTYHGEDSRQAERDAMKDAILKKYGLPLLRLRTDGSRERQQILARLRE